MIRVVVDDLAFVAADAVVRSANHLLEPVTPAMARLDEQGGGRFARQRRVQSPLDPGAAVVTGAGDLTASYVIHLVIQSREVPASADTVRRALVSGWQRAADWGLRSVAAPLVGVGPGVLGVEESADLLARTFREHRAGAAPSELTIVVEHERERETVGALLGRSAR